jgi:segregation and condensation protein B
MRSKGRVQEMARRLAEEYRDRGGALEVIELDDGRFAMQLKPAHVPRVRRLAIRPLLTRGALRTLAYVAYRQPVPQSRVAIAMGDQSYDHIRELERMGLISGERLGKTQLLRTTNIYADYFNLSRDIRVMKRQLRAMFEATGKPLEEQAMEPGGEAVVQREKAPPKPG